MSEKITAGNLDEVIQKNREIHEEIQRNALVIRTNNRMQISSSSQLAMQILKSYGLLRFPLDNPYWSGAIFVENGKKIPVINTALPRANQYFTAWHEIYHLVFDQVSFSRMIPSEAVMEERKADYFASLMLLGELMPYYIELADMSFLHKVFHCMDAFQAPYKAVLIALYESAVQNGNETVAKLVKEYFDASLSDIAGQFRDLGLDDNLVKPSYVINVRPLQAKIQEHIKLDPDLNYHYENASFLKNVVSEMKLLLEDADD
ncbi:ImmA/IrrE family metallo-endopeptidase [Lacrimispora indolis]|uniref:ImmA/IrrE family metallo-endopeptidase n=1 Tax=Lacrimispora indolis TaxID=69825 RepID=UPI0004137836|nr:ImmA/IrrE family metallo-endopeptidase [[Clostridium] methoxybenzovorans]